MQTPQWYWARGLHDARVCGYAEEENCLTLYLDAEGAMFEQDICKICFHHPRILTPDFQMEQLRGSWWLRDELEQKGPFYYLYLKFDTAKCKTRVLELRFRDAQVERKHS